MYPNKARLVDDFDIFHQLRVAIAREDLKADSRVVVGQEKVLLVTNAFHKDVVLLSSQLLISLQVFVFVVNVLRDGPCANFVLCCVVQDEAGTAKYVVWLMMAAECLLQEASISQLGECDVLLLLHANAQIVVKDDQLQRFLVKCNRLSRRVPQRIFLIYEESGLTRTNKKVIW